MIKSDQKKWFSEIDAIITEPLKFKAKLAIGEDAYKSLRIKKAVWEIWDVAGVAGTGAWFAQLPCVASLLASKGILISLGLATATTPIGWVVLAGVLSGGAWLGITRYLKSLDGERVDVIPKFINTPLDVLALCLFDLIAPLALKVANVDDHIDPSERLAICSYFVKEWGYDQRFIEEGILFTESKLTDYKIKDLAQTLAEFQKQNPDCNYNSMSKEIVSFLKTVIESDGRIDEREEMAVEKVKMVFDEVDRVNIKQMTKSGFETISETVVDSGRTIKTKTGEMLEKTSDLTTDALAAAKEHGAKTAEFVSDTCSSTMTQGKKLFENLTARVTKKNNI